MCKKETKEQPITIWTENGDDWCFCSARLIGMCAFQSFPKLCLITRLGSLCISYVQPETVPCSGMQRLWRSWYPDHIQKMSKKGLESWGAKPAFPFLLTLAGHTAKVSAIDCGSNTHLRLREDKAGNETNLNVCGIYQWNGCNNSVCVWLFAQ